jgi:hypothetical protein
VTLVKIYYTVLVVLIRCCGWEVEVEGGSGDRDRGYVRRSVRDTE